MSTQSGKTWLAFVLAVGLGAGAAAPARANEALNRLQEMKVELAWLANDPVASWPLVARVSRQTLEVYGQVPSETIRALAITLAQQESRLPVKDGLTVNPQLRPPTIASVAAEKLQESARSVLGRLLPQQQRTLTVQGQANGRLILGGEVPSLEDKLAASRMVAGVPGFRCVINNLKVTQGDPAVVRVSSDGRLTVSASELAAPSKPVVQMDRPKAEQVKTAVALLTPVPMPVPAKPVAFPADIAHASFTDKPGSGAEVQPPPTIPKEPNKAGTPHSLPTEVVVPGSFPSRTTAEPPLATKPSQDWQKWRWHGYGAAPPRAEAPPPAPAPGKKPQPTPANGSLPPDASGLAAPSVTGTTLLDTARRWLASRPRLFSWSQPATTTTVISPGTAQVVPVSQTGKSATPAQPIKPGAPAAQTTNPKRTPPATDKVVPAAATQSKASQDTPIAGFANSAQHTMLKQRVERCVGAQGRNVDLILYPNQTLLVRLKLRNVNDADQVKSRIAKLPELATYRLCFNVA